MGEYPRLRHWRQSLPRRPPLTPRPAHGFLTGRREAHGHDTGAIKRKIVFPGRGVVAIEDTVLVTTGPPESLTITPRGLVVL